VTDGLALGRYQTMARCVGDQRVLIARLTTRYSRAFALHEMMRERNRIRTAPRSAHARNRIRTSPQAHTDNEREREKRKKKYEWSSGDGPDTPLSFSLFRAFAFAAVLATRTGTGAQYIPRRDIAPPDADAGANVTPRNSPPRLEYILFFHYLLHCFRVYVVEIELSTAPYRMGTWITISTKTDQFL
jgi:hypothetical protein